MNNRLIVSPENEQTSLTVVSKDVQQYLSVSTEHNVSVVSDKEQQHDMVASKETALLMVPVQTVKQDLVTKTDSIVYVPLATNNSYGIIKPGEGLTIKDGVLSAIYAGEGGGVTATYVQNSIHEHNMDEMAHPYLREKMLEIEAISKGRAKALAYLTYSDMVFAVNNFLPEEHSIGQSIYIGTKNVPDLWIYGIEDDFEEYDYISDESIVDILNEKGYIKIGYYLLSPLETGKTVVGNYVTLDTIQTVSGIKTFTEQIGLLNAAEGKVDYIKHINNNFLIASHDGKSLLNIDEQLEKIYSFNKELANKEFIKSSYLSFTESQTLTEDQKALVRSKIGAGSGSFSGAFNDLSGIPTLNTNNNSSLTVGEETIKNTIKLHKVSKTGLLSDLLTDSTHRTVTDSEKLLWNNKASNSDFLKLEGTVDTIVTKTTILEDSYNELYLKQTEQATTINSLLENKADKSEIKTKTSQLTNDSNFVSDENYVHTDNNYSTAEKNKLASLENYDDTELSARVDNIEQNKADKSEIPTVNNGTLIIQKNGNDVAVFRANQSTNSIANIIVPTTASDVNALPSTTEYGASLELSIDNTTYVMTARLKDQHGNYLGTAQTIDLPLESVVISGSYDSENKRVVLKLKDGSTIAFSVADLVSDLASQSSLDQTNTNLNNLTIRVNNAETNITKKVDKVEGKGLSTNDFTTVYKTKLDGLENYDDTAVRNLISAKYTKPSTGIPKTDLASGVQASLDKANSALQSVPEGYITETELNKKGYATKTDVSEEVSALNTAIGKKANQTDLTTISGKVGTLENNYTSLSNTKADKTEVSAGVNEAKTYTNTEIQKVRGTGGESLTLAGLNSAIATNSQEIGNFETGLDNVGKDITDLNNNKVDKETGKGLSSNDFTTAYINQIATNEGNIREINTNIGTIQGNITSLQNTKADKSEIPDVSDFITNTVNNLTNYYLKSETYSKQEVNNLIGSITSISFEVVSVLPTTGSSNIIYLLAKTGATNDVYDEYIYVNNSWEKIGSTSVDLSNYYNKTEVDTKLGEKLNLSGGTLTGSLKMASAELTGYLKMATGTNNAIVYGTSRKNVVEVSSTTESDGTTRTITMGNSDDYLKLKGKSLTFNGGGVATLNDLNNSINNAKLTIKQNGTEIGSFTSNAIEDVEVNIETGESVKLYDSTGQNTDGGMTQKATTDELNKKPNFVETEEVSITVNRLLDLIYPINSIRLSDNGNEQNFMGGTWIITGQGRTIIGAGVLGDNNYSVGDLIEAGLPNITGTFTAARGMTRDGVTVTGALTSGTTGSPLQSQTFDGYGNSPNILGLDASKSNPIYGKSNTVHMNSFVTYIYKRIG